MQKFITTYAAGDALRKQGLVTTSSAREINPHLFGKLIARHRKALRMNQQETARRIFKDRNLTDASAQSRMSRIESGKVKLTTGLMKRVSRFLQMPVIDIKQACMDDHCPTIALEPTNLHFDPAIIDHLPTIENYIQIINTHLKEKNIKGVALGFQQLCQAATNLAVDHPAKIPDDFHSHQQ